MSDTKTGLTWKKCSEGQSGVDCRIGTATTYTWQGALQQAQRVNNNGGFAGYKNWRLPSIKELNSIVEEQCSEPSINLAVFPESQNNAYWSSSPDADSSSYAWLVFFFGGNSYLNLKSSNYFVRLVREGANQHTATAGFTSEELNLWVSELNFIERGMLVWVRKKLIILYTKPCFEKILLDYDSAKFEFSDKATGQAANVVEGRINSKNTYGGYTGWQQVRIVNDMEHGIAEIHYENRLHICHPLD